MDFTKLYRIRHVVNCPHSPQYIETLQPDTSIAKADSLRNRTVEQLWGLTDTFNVLNKDSWNREVNEVRRRTQSVCKKAWRMSYSLPVPDSSGAPARHRQTNQVRERTFSNV